MSMAGLRAAIASEPAGCDVTIRLSALEAYCLDEWIEQREEPRPSRAEAILRLMRESLCQEQGR